MGWIDSSPGKLSPSPEQASNCQLARFLYYTGRIKALQLEYSEAHRCLLQAQRKAPQSSALGFKLAAHKLGAIVQLLLGEKQKITSYKLQVISYKLHVYKLQVTS